MKQWKLKRTFSEVLKIADEIGLGRDKVNLLFDLAKVRIAENRLEQAVELLAVVLQQPTSRLHRLGGGRVRDRVQELLDTLKTELSTKAYTAAWGRGNVREFDQVIVDLLTEI